MTYVVGYECWNCGWEAEIVRDGKLEVKTHEIGCGGCGGNARPSYVRDFDNPLERKKRKEECLV